MDRPWKPTHHIMFSNVSFPVMFFGDGCYYSRRAWELFQCADFYVDEEGLYFNGKIETKFEVVEVFNAIL